METVNDGTISLADETGLGRDRVGPEMLVLVLDAARPFEAPLLVPLTGVDELVLGRGPARTWPTSTPQDGGAGHSAG